MTTYYVDNVTGNDGDSGLTLADAWLTVGHAVASVGAGDIIRIVTTGVTYTDTFTTTANYSANPVTIRGHDSSSWPIINPSAPWTFNGADGWTVRYIDFRGWTNYYGPIRYGDNLCTVMEVLDCWFRHARGHGISITGSGVSGLLVERCHFRDIRSRQPILNRNAIVCWGNADGVDVFWCTFEDIGSDGIHIHSGTTITDFVIADCGFFVNRPYSVAGTSLYNGDVTTWQNYSTNVAEEGNDIWEVAAGGGESVTVRRCYFSGFYPVVANQDASFTHYGYGLIAQRDTDAYECHGSTFYDCHWGAIFSYGAGTWAAGELDGCFIHYSHDDGVWSHGGNALHGLTVTDNTIIDSALASMNFRWTLATDVSGNICQQAPNDRGNNAGAANVDYNLWLAGGTPVYFQGPNDYADHTLEIREVDCLDGKVSITNDINEIYIAAAALALHPSLATLNADLSTAVRGWAATIAEQSTPDVNMQNGRFSLELT